VFKFGSWFLVRRSRFAALAFARAAIRCSSRTEITPLLEIRPDLDGHAAVNKRYITEETRLHLDALAVTALDEVTGLMEYLQSPEALRNARRARERRIASRPERLAKHQQRPNNE